MYVIKVRNVHEALPEGIYQLLSAGDEEETRNGPVLVMPQPVTTMYTHPRERVIFWPEREANPFFHFYEALWMLGGRNDLLSLARFVPAMKQFSDDGKTFHGAYGHRWRQHFKFDQLTSVIDGLRENPGCRRQVVIMFDPKTDSVSGKSKMRDIPCNLAATVQVRGGALDMMVTNRSNDIIWGAYGANAVHFSMLQEYVAAGVGVPVGMYWQVSFNFHAYKKTLEPMAMLGTMAKQPPGHGMRTPYEGQVSPFKMVNSPIEQWNQDLMMFLDEGNKAMGYRDVFFRRVALPILRTHRAFKELKGQDKFSGALAEAAGIKATDWRLAIEEWITRRQLRWEEKDVG
jgi:thymidylate synthase